MRVSRFLPKSLLGQVMLVLALGLFVAQSLSGFLLYQAAEQRRETVLVNAIAFRFIADQNALDRRERREMREAMRRAGRPLPDPQRMGLRSPIRIGIEARNDSPIGPDEPRLRKVELALKALLDEQQVPAGEIQVTHRRASSDPFVQRMMQRRPFLRSPEWQRDRVLVAAVELSDGSGWRVARMPVPPIAEGARRTIIVQTLVIFVILFALLYLVLRRLTRPLALLRDRVDDFSRHPEDAVMIEESGPADVRQLISAHNAMESRIAALLDEKDVMLGAIGHDLKTPLAALRVRIESVENDAQRERMAQSIEDITNTLDDILALARVGRAGNDRERVDLAALTSAVVEEFEDLDQPVTLADSPRLVAEVQVTWLKRALRNLVSNAVRYGGSAEVALAQQGDRIILRVEDQGPGIPGDQIQAMLEPFTRGEASRNRATGGAGLGLTLARAIAEAHGGQLVLSNRVEGGLRAEIRLPV